MSLIKKGLVSIILPLTLFIFIMLFSINIEYLNTNSGINDLLRTTISIAVPSLKADQEPDPMTICQGIGCPGGEAYCDSWYIQNPNGKWVEVKCYKLKIIIT